MDNFLARLKNEWKFFDKWAIPELERARLAPPDETKVKNVKTLIDKMTESVEGAWKKGPAVNFYARKLYDVRKLLELVRPIIALPDPHDMVEGGRVVSEGDDFPFVLADDGSGKYIISDEHYKIEHKKHRDELRRRQQLLNSANERVSELCNDVRQVNHFVESADSVKRTLDDMKNGTPNGQMCMEVRAG